MKTISKVKVKTWSEKIMLHVSRSVTSTWIHWVSNSIWATSKTLWYPFHSFITVWFKSYGQKSHFPIGLCNGRVENWPDLRLLKWKIRNIHSVGIHSNISFSKFEYIWTKTVPTARSSSLKLVPSCAPDFDLTWWADFLTWEVKICTHTKLHSRCIFKFCAGTSNLAALRALFLRYSRKQGRSFFIRVSIIKWDSM